MTSVSESSNNAESQEAKKEQAPAAPSPAQGAPAAAGGAAPAQAQQDPPYAPRQLVEELAEKNRQLQERLDRQAEELEALKPQKKRIFKPGFKVRIFK